MTAIVNILGPRCGDLAVMVMILVFGGLDETLKHGELFVQQGCGGQEPQGRVESRETARSHGLQGRARLPLRIPCPLLAMCSPSGAPLS
ncbi:hypothetical protein GE21DRAFT_1219051 [Neurospora crassa]|nr:hypothetical protein B9J10.80 [imported] - Neurospora crassa [Neurospora crassa]KHE80178.1 hypothetical protein GE21DRAFT_1219051 [Neurospora crassa]